MSESFKPYVSSDTKITEFSIRAIVLGVVLGLIFGIGNAYLGLKVGTTVSASIPAAVLSMAILSLFYKKVTILENNIVQTIASVGEGLASGVIFTAPALFFAWRASFYLQNDATFFSRVDFRDSFYDSDETLYYC